jgi:hypothetical protein
MKLYERHYTQFGVLNALEQQLNQLEVFKLTSSLQLCRVKFAYHLNYQFSDLKNGVSSSNLDKILDKGTARFLSNVLNSVLAHLQTAGLALHGRLCFELSLQLLKGGRLIQK